MFNNSPLNSLAKKDVPNAGDNGADARNSAVFINLKDEVRKLDKAATNGHVNWSFVASQATNYLETQHKDVLVVAYLSVAWVHLNYFSGLLQVVEFLELIFKKYGVKLYPQENAAQQVTALKWMVSQILSQCQKFSNSSYDKKELKQLLKNLQALDKTCHKLYQQDLFKPLHRWAQIQFDVITSKPKQEKAPAPVSTLQAKVEPINSTIDEPVESIKTTSILYTPEAVDESLLKVSANLRDANLFAPQAYFYSRTAIWNDSDSIKSDTSLMAPELTMQMRVKEILDEQPNTLDFKELEQIALDNPYWLDIHYQVALWSKALSKADAVYNLLRAYLGVLVQNNPVLLSLKFIDGEPCANKNTREWLNAKEAVKAQKTVKTIKTESEHSLDELLRKKFTDINQLIDAVQEKINSTKAGKQKLLYYLDFCEYLQDESQLTVLPTFLHQLQESLTHFNLAEWDPELAVRVLTTLYLANKSLGNEANKQQLQFALAKLMILDHNKFTELEKV